MFTLFLPAETGRKTTLMTYGPKKRGHITGNPVRLESVIQKPSKFLLSDTYMTTFWATRPRSYVKSFLSRTKRCAVLGNFRFKKCCKDRRERATALVTVLVGR
jgi:hypothetical protein